MFSRRRVKRNAILVRAKLRIDDKTEELVVCFPVHAAPYRLQLPKSRRHNTPESKDVQQRIVEHESAACVADP